MNETTIAKQRRELARQAEANGWPPDFFERSAGSIPDFPDRDPRCIGISSDDVNYISGHAAVRA